MKKVLMVLCTAFLFIAATPVSSTKAKSLIFHSFHVTLTANNSQSYVVQIDFNLSTQQFGVITCHHVSTPATELDVDRTGGSGSTTGGNGSTSVITSALNLTISGTAITMVLPAGGPYTFDY